MSYLDSRILNFRLSALGTTSGSLQVMSKNFAVGMDSASCTMKVLLGPVLTLTQGLGMLRAGEIRSEAQSLVYGIPIVLPPNPFPSVGPTPEPVPGILN